MSKPRGARRLADLGSIEQTFDVTSDAKVRHGMVDGLRDAVEQAQPRNGMIAPSVTMDANGNPRFVTPDGRALPRPQTAALPSKTETPFEPPARRASESAATYAKRVRAALRDHVCRLAGQAHSAVDSNGHLTAAGEDGGAMSDEEARELERENALDPDDEPADTEDDDATEELDELEVDALDGGAGDPGGELAPATREFLGRQPTLEELREHMRQQGLL